MSFDVSGLEGREWFYLSGIFLFVVMLAGASVLDGGSCGDYVVVSPPNEVDSYGSFSELRGDMLENGRISGAEDWHQIKQDAGLIRDDIDADAEFEVLKEDCGGDPIPAW